jgi:hypothetical protein
MGCSLMDIQYIVNIQLKAGIKNSSMGSKCGHVHCSRRSPAKCKGGITTKMGFALFGVMTVQTYSTFCGYTVLWRVTTTLYS